MKAKHIFSLLTLAAAISAPIISEATIYLMKGEKIVAAYPDNAVDYITFETPENPDVPKDYDVDTRSYFMDITYYGDTQAAGGYNYNVWVSNKEMEKSGFVPEDAVVFNLSLMAPEPSDPTNLIVPDGVYTLGEPGTGIYTICPANYCYIVEENTKYRYKDVTFTVETVNGKPNFEIIATGDNGKVYHTVYTGQPEIYDQSIDWLTEDQYIQGGVIIASYLEEDLGGNVNLNMTIAEYGYDAEGWLKMPSNYITFVGNVEMDETGNILPNTWKIIDPDNDEAETNTFVAGKCIDFMGSSFPVYTTINHYYGTSQRDVEVGLIKSGTLSYTKGKRGYTLTYELTTDKGVKVSGIWEGGALHAEDHPYEKSLLLDKDYQLDFSTAKCNCYQWDEETLFELCTFDDNIQYVGDRVELRLCPKNEKFVEGVYKVKADKNCAGTILPGKFQANNGVGEGSVFVAYSREEGGKVLKAAGISDGTFEVIKNDDGTWTVNYDLYDGQDNPKRIYGTWTGKVEIN